MIIGPFTVTESVKRNLMFTTVVEVAPNQTGLAMALARPGGISTVKTNALSKFMKPVENGFAKEIVKIGVFLVVENVIMNIIKYLARVVCVKEESSTTCAMVFVKAIL